MAPAERPERIGVFGGTFDPIHNAHIEIARAAMKHAGLDRVLFVVAARPPHKQDDTFAAPAARFEMVEAALRGEAGMAPCDIELRRAGPSYTADTLRELKRLHPGAELFLILGMDACMDLPQWREPEAILANARIVAVPRPGGDGHVPRGLEAKCVLLPFKETDISSTDVRDAIVSGGRYREYVPAAVADYIDHHGLYHGRIPDAARG